MSDLTQLPRGWTVAALSQCATRITDGTHLPPAFVDSGVSFLFVRHIVDERLTFDDTKFISEKAWQDFQNRCPIEQGDVLYTAVGSYGVAVPVDTERRFSFQRHIAHIKPHRQLDSRFLAYFLNSPFGLTQAHRVARGVAQKTVTLGDLKQFSINLAPLNEQRRIVAKIEELFSDLDAGVAALQRAKANLKRYRAAVLKAAVEGRLTADWRANHPATEPASALLARILKERRQRWEADQLAKFAAAGKEPPRNWREKYVEPTPPETAGLPELPAGWCWASAEQLSDEVRAITYGVVKLGDPVPNGIPTLRSSNVRSLRLEVDDVKRISPAVASQYQRTFLRGGELLFTVRGTLGGIAVAPDYCKGWNVSREVAVLAPVDSEMGPVVAIFVASSQIQNWMSRNTRGIAYTGVNIETLKELPIPLIPSVEGAQLAGRVEELLSQFVRAETEIEHGLVRAARLRQSILKEAFAGKLVPQDPRDEPASALLTRLQADRTTSPATASKRPRRAKA